MLSTSHWLGWVNWNVTRGYMHKCSWLSVIKCDWDYSRANSSDLERSLLQATIEIEWDGIDCIWFSAKAITIHITKYIALIVGENICICEEC